MPRVRRRRRKASWAPGMRHGGPAPSGRARPHRRDGEPRARGLAGPQAKNALQCSVGARRLAGDEAGVAQVDGTGPLNMVLPVYLGVGWRGLVGSPGGYRPPPWGVLRRNTSAGVPPSGRRRCVAGAFRHHAFARRWTSTRVTAHTKNDGGACGAKAMGTLDVGPRAGGLHLRSGRRRDLPTGWVRAGPSRLKFEPR
jgi:hypothetical protein